jgi:hypothetical protein
MSINCQVYGGLGLLLLLLRRRRRLLLLLPPGGDLDSRPCYLQQKGLPS